MREAGVSGKAPGRRKRTMASAPLGPVAENVLDRAFEPETWTADMTQIWTGEGWLYLAVVLDLHSRRVVEWAARPSASRALVVEALQNALRSRRPARASSYTRIRGRNTPATSTRRCCGASASSRR